MRIFSLGENAITIEFGNIISEELNDKVLGLTKFFEENPFPGLQELCPAYSSLTLFYDIKQVRDGFPDYKTAFEAVKNLIEKTLTNFKQESNSSGRFVEIPISFEKAPDLEFVASLSNLTYQELIEIFLSRSYRVFMLGFLPGFAYMGLLDDRIVAPRKAEPRIRVEKGSVGVAGRQTGIYPVDSPGGWQIIGKTNIELFNTDDLEPPTLLQPGDIVKFHKL
jgi:inhibitor of KinA